MEFTEVMRQMQRMCSNNACRRCPLGEDGCCMLAGIDLVDMNPNKIESITAKWMTDNPEKEYPPWAEGFAYAFPGGSPRALMPCAFIGKAGCAENNFDCDACRKQPMHPAVAEKLGVKPIGGEGAS